MPLSRAQLQKFVVDVADLFSVRPPRLSRRRRHHCRWKQKTLHLGRVTTREDLAHSLAHYLHGELKFADGRPRRGLLHGREFHKWQLLVGNYIAQEFGEGEGVTL